MKHTFLLPILIAVLLPTAAVFAGQTQTPEDRLEALGITLPAVSPSIANYVGVVQSGNLLFLSGHLPRLGGGSVITGKLGKTLEVKDGYEAARLSGIALLATMKAHLGDLSRVKRVVKVFGMVNATPEFEDHSKVINGCSDLMVDVFGDKGRHARAASGFASLPVGACVEIEMIVEVED